MFKYYLDHIFATLSMKKDILKYFAAVFFITLYLLNGAATIMPVLFSDTVVNSFLTALPDTEAENNKNNTEERFDTEKRELYLHHNYLGSVSSSIDVMGLKNIEENNIAFKQHFFAAIPTPPPERG